MLTRAAKVTGTPNLKAWAQVFEFRDEETQAHLIVSISLEKKDADLVFGDLGKEFAENLQKNFLSLFKKSTLSLLRSSTEEVLKNIIDRTQPQVVVAFFWEEYAYFTVWGQGKVFLYRNQKLLPILVGKGDTLGSCSGKITVGDVFLFGTPELFEILSQEDLSVALALQDLSTVVEEINTKIHNQESPHVSASIVQTGEDVEPQIEIPVQSVSLNKTLFKIDRPNFLQKVASLLPDSVKIPSPTRDPSKKTAVLVGILLLFILVVSIFFGSTQKNSQREQEELRSKLGQAHYFYNDSLLQKDINPKLARELFAKAEKIVFELDEKKTNTQEFSEFKEKLKNSRVEILGIIEESPQVFYDLSLVRSGVSASEIALFANEVAIFDAEGKRIITVGTSGKETRVAGGTEKIPTASSFSPWVNRFLILSKDGVVRLNRDGSVDSAINSDTDWGEIFRLISYGNNLYLVAKDGKIFRYPDSGTSFGSKVVWRKDAMGFNVKDATIDGYIWLLGGNGEINKLARGEAQNFSIKGLEGSISNASSLYTNEELEGIYVLDQTNGRIVEIDKSNGEIRKEYKNEGIKEAVDLSISKSSGKIYLLTKSKILELPLK